MAEKKITKKEVITKMLLDEYVASNPMYKDYLENELKLLNKKAESKKPTKTQEENEVYKTAILEVLTASDKGMTISEIISSSDTLKGFSNQKVTALVRILKEEGKVVKNVDGKKSIFSIA